jgi:hypothetical protein
MPIQTYAAIRDMFGQDQVYQPSVVENTPSMLKFLLVALAK